MCTPGFSIVIPSYQGAGKLPALLGVLKSGMAELVLQSEVIVVLDASSDDSAVVLELFATEHPKMNIQVIENQKNSGPSHSRNAGVAVARHEVILFLDDDCLPRKEWFQRQGEIWGSQSSKVVGVGGYVTPHKLETFSEKYADVFNPIQPWGISSAESSIFQRLKNYYVQSDLTGQGVSYFAGANMSFLRSKFLSVDGFSSEMRVGEDIAICERIRNTFGDDSLQFDPMLVMHHEYPQKFYEMLKKKFKYGRELTLQAHKGRISFSINPGPALIFFISLILSSTVATIINSNSAELFLTILALVSIGYAVLVVRMKANSGPHFLHQIRYGLAFIAIEFANNLGFIVGVAELLLRGLVRRLR